MRGFVEQIKHALLGMSGRSARLTRKPKPKRALPTQGARSPRALQGPRIGWAHGPRPGLGLGLCQTLAHTVRLYSLTYARAAQV